MTIMVEVCHGETIQVYCISTNLPMSFDFHCALHYFKENKKKVALTNAIQELKVT